MTPTAGSAETFVPHPLLRGGHAQTVVCHFLPRHSLLPPPEHRLVRVAPEVQVLCLCHWQAERRRALTLVLVHGLEGSCDSGYIIGTANKAWTARMNVVRLNVRSCGGTEALGSTLYHSGMSEDVGQVLRAVVTEDRLERIALAGFSMGGNQVLKLAGEWGREHVVPPQLVGVAAVSPAMDLASSADALHLPQNRLYEWRFLLSLRQRLRRKQRLFPDHFKIDKWWWRSIRDFDDRVTAPLSGFADAADYYRRASASRVLEFISVPTLIIHALDDPFIRIEPATRAKLAVNPALRYIETQHGGHCGFLAAQARRNTDKCAVDDGRWAERQVVEFLRRAHGSRV
jgi:predicted alpha/beta-fold hydrolase